MKKKILFVLIVLSALLRPCAAQLTTASLFPDTFRIQKFPLRFYYGAEKMKPGSQMQSILLSKKDPIVTRDWQTAKTLRYIGIGVQVLGLGVEAIGFSKIAGGDGDEHNFLIKGVGIMLGGVILQVVASGPLKHALTRYNGLHTGRINPKLPPPMPTVFKQTLLLPDTQPVPDNIDRKTGLNGSQKRIIPGSIWWGISAGIGWSKQKLNYEDEFDQPLEKARVYSYSLQIGKQVTENLGWQIELSQTQHGYRESVTQYVQSIKSKAKVDLRARYWELPVLLNARIPVGGKILGIEALPGLNFGYLNSAKIVAHAEGEGDDTKVRLSSSSKLDLREVKSKDKWDVALLLGARITKGFGPGRFFLEGRYHLGVLNLERNSEADTEGKKPKSYNRTFLLRVGFQMPF